MLNQNFSKFYQKCEHGKGRMKEVDRDNKKRKCQDSEEKTQDFDLAHLVSRQQGEIMLIGIPSHNHNTGLDQALETKGEEMRYFNEWFWQIKTIQRTKGDTKLVTSIYENGKVVSLPEEGNQLAGRILGGTLVNFKGTLRDCFDLNFKGVEWAF